MSERRSVGARRLVDYPTCAFGKATAHGSDEGSRVDTVAASSSDAAAMLRALTRLFVGLIIVVAVVAVGLVVAYYSAKSIWADSDPPPEFATGWRADVPEVRTSTTMAVAANPWASKAGHEMLSAGGTAIDAAVAMQAVLTLVEPQSSGIAGGAFLLLYDSGNRSITAYDGRETAPAGAGPDLFLKKDGTPLSFFDAIIGGRSVGVPGVLRMLELAHQQHGRMPWARLFEPAIRLCKEGFEVSPRLNSLLRIDPFFRTQPAARAYFYQEDGRAHPVGHRIRNPALGRVLTEIAQKGPDAFYEGRIAEAIVKTVREAKRPSPTAMSLNMTMIREMGAPYGSGLMASVDNPGTLTLADLKSYEPKVRKPVCVAYRKWRVCGFGPPTSGGITTLQIIKMLERFDLASISPRSVEFAHLLAESSKLAFADRGRYIADPDFVDVPVAGLLDEKYLAERSKMISPERAGPRRKPGKPAGVKTAFAEGIDLDRPSTSHMVVVDADRNVVSMTSSVENLFGSRLMTEGFVLNNQLTDFSFVPKKGATPVANAVAPGKRPRSSMSPLIVLDRATDEPVLAVGSPGGSRIILYVAQVTLAVLDAGLSPQEAIELPHIVNRNGPVELENEGWADGELEKMRTGLTALGHEIRVSSQNSGLHAVLLGPNELVGGADPRREGLAVGD